jgi:O-antigen/teichoic acid export membrane protein
VLNWRATWLQNTRTRKNKAILRAIGLSLSRSMVTIICHFLTLMVLIRMLDKASMGAYIALIITLLVVLLSDLGVDLALVRKYPEETRPAERLWFSAH